MLGLYPLLRFDRPPQHRLGGASFHGCNLESWCHDAPDSHIARGVLGSVPADFAGFADSVDFVDCLAHGPYLVRADSGRPASIEGLPANLYSNFRCFHYFHCLRCSVVAYSTRTQVQAVAAGVPPGALVVSQRCRAACHGKTGRPWLGTGRGRQDRPSLSDCYEQKYTD